jgi:hypothetical protein
MISICGIHSTMIDEQWETVHHLVQRALDATIAGNLYTLESIKDYLKSRDMQLWLLIEESKVHAAVITQVLVYPKAKVLDVLFMGGDIYDTWEVVYQARMREFAAEQGCDYARGYGRLGWARKVKNLGIKPSIYFDVPLKEESYEILS